MHVHDAIRCRHRSYSVYILIDERNIPPLGRPGDPDDIIASVRVKLCVTVLGGGLPANARVSNVYF